MRIQFGFTLASIVVLSFGIAQASGLDRNPCDSDFKLSVTVNAVDGIDTWPIGVNLDYKAAKGLGTASRVQTKDQAEFTAAQCGSWQKTNWSSFQKILSEAHRPERSKVVCRSIASIRYESGAGESKSEVCLGSAASDRVSKQFKNFFENTDGMVR